MRSRPLADRVSSARRRAFVGRRVELELFRQAIEAPGEPPFTVLHVHGPGGIGKSALLLMFGELARDAGADVIRIDGREVPPDPAVVRRVAAPALAARARTVLLVDTFELIAPLDGWLREELLPELSADVIVVLAGRAPPTRPWTDDPGWRVLSRVLPLAPLSRIDAAALLADAPLADADRGRVLDFAAGNPLALTLAHDLAGRGGDGVPTALAGPSVVGTLVGRLVEAAPGPEHLRTLQVCARARFTSEALLRDVLGVDEVGALFEWLRAQPYVESASRGLFPHDVVRDVLLADLRWRAEDAARQLRLDVRADAIRQVRSGVPQVRAEGLLDLLFDLRHDPVARAHLDWDTFGVVTGEPARAEDRAGIATVLAAWAGPAHVEPVLQWLGAPAARFIVYRDGAGIRGAVVRIALHEADPSNLAADPVAAAVLTWARDRGVRPGEPVTLGRCSADREVGERPSPAMNITSIEGIIDVADHPDLAFDVYCAVDADYAEPAFNYTGYDRVHDIDAGSDGHGVFALDLRTATPEVWRDAVEVWRAAVPEPTATPGGPDAEFVETVRQALRTISRPDLLARSRLLAAGVAPDAQALHRLLVDAIAGLRDHPRDAKLHRALDRTYLRPATTQELAAEVLGLPFSTYRRHLTHGVARVAAAVWTASRN